MSTKKASPTGQDSHRIEFITRLTKVLALVPSAHRRRDDVKEHIDFFLHEVGSSLQEHKYLAGLRPVSRSPVISVGPPGTASRRAKLARDAEVKRIQRQHWVEYNFYDGHVRDGGAQVLVHGATTLEELTAALGRQPYSLRYYVSSRFDGYAPITKYELKNEAGHKVYGSVEFWEVKWRDNLDPDAVLKIIAHTRETTMPIENVVKLVAEGKAVDTGFR